MEPAVPNGENNAPPPAGGGAPPFLQEFLRNLPSILEMVGVGTSATGAGGLSKQIFVEEAVSKPTMFFLFATLLGGIGTIYAARRVRRDAGVVIFFSCFLLLIAAGSIVGFDYFEVALALFFAN